MAEGEARGRQEAICKYLDARFGDSSKGLQKKVKQVGMLKRWTRSSTKSIPSVRWRKPGPSSTVRQSNEESQEGDQSLTKELKIGGEDCRKNNPMIRKQKTIW